MTEQELSNEQHWMLFVLLLRFTAEAKGITQAEIAEKSGLKQSNVSRFMALKYVPTLRTFIAIAKALEVNFFFEDKEDKTDLSVIFNKAMDELGRTLKNIELN